MSLFSKEIKNNNKNFINAMFIKNIDNIKNLEIECNTKVKIIQYNNRNDIEISSNKAVNIRNYFNVEVDKSKEIIKIKEIEFSFTKKDKNETITIAIPADLNKLKIQSYNIIDIGLISINKLKTINSKIVYINKISNKRDLEIISENVSGLIIKEICHLKNSDKKVNIDLKNTNILIKTLSIEKIDVSLYGNSSIKIKNESNVKEAIVSIFGSSFIEMKNLTGDYFYLNFLNSYEDYKRSKYSIGDFKNLKKAI